MTPDTEEWEYTSVAIPLWHNQSHIDTMNNYGKNRWELVQVVHSESLGFVHIFKRPKQ